ncbi:beta-galactosidase [Microbacterium karelineae]|uniref:beta-galactosidase n=1 Tax=Microbacterium karelineae TaxID=2654283 RepID=UPI0012E999AC|nr:beta-galactosidase [Microbacterium karelineae]
MSRPDAVDHEPLSHLPLAIRVPRHADPAPAPLDMGDPAGADGRIAVCETHLTRGGAPWIPVMGEYHFSRDRAERWRDELAKMRAGGVTVVATYVLWILHEERRGRVRWDGDLDLRRFVETAHDVGLDVVVRIGPWAHGETRNGGFPDWLQALPVAHRTDDPAYLDIVRGWIDEIAAQLRGLLHAEGGPVVGMQVENELYDRPDHIRTLRRMAEDAGIRVPLWTATGWGGAELPEGDVLPVYAGYSDGFWEEADTGWPAFGRTHFTFSDVRDDLTVGADLREAPLPDEAPGAGSDPWPYATCELGGGMTVAYHRRPLVDSDDVAALALTKIGSGSSWQGFYLFHGGRHVTGELSTTQESQATGYPNDVPVRDYDFFAPLGADGRQRPHFHALRLQHLMLAQYGHMIAPHRAIVPPQDPVRWAVRGDGESAWLFVGAHQPAAEPLPDVDGVRFAVELADRTIEFPTRPVTLSSGTYTAWPVRQRLGGIDAVTATAQPIVEIDGADGPVVFLRACAGMPVELQLEGVSAQEVRGAATARLGGVLVATPDATPGIGCEVRVRETTFVFLDEQAASGLWKGLIDGRETVVIWPGAGWFDGSFRVVAPEADTILHSWPPLAGAESGEGVLRPCAIAADPRAVTPVAVPTPRPVAAPVRTGGDAGRLSAPDDADFARLEPVRIDVPDAVFEGAHRAILEIDWTGDALRLYAGDTLVTDQFWSGRLLEVDLTPYRREIAAEELRLVAFAWDPASAVHVDPRVRPRATRPVLEIAGARIRSERIRDLR